MRTQRLPFSEDAVREAARVLAGGGLVAFPTETVYGLGARADRAEAVRRIFTAKGRPAGNPLIVHVADRGGAAALAAEWPEVADALAAAFWPGPLTLVVKRAPGAVADEVAAAGPTVAVRVPAHPAALALLQAARVPVAAPSANRSTTVSPTTADHVLKTLDGEIDVVLDAGPTGFGIESTIVDVSGAVRHADAHAVAGVPRRPVLTVLRHGAVPASKLVSFGDVIDATKVAVAETARAAAPGMHAKHYAPRAKVAMAAPESVQAEVEARRAARARVGSIERTASAAGAGDALRCVLPADPEGYARELYAALHALDDAGCDLIVIAQVPEDDAWAAVRDRLRRAAAD